MIIVSSLLQIVAQILDRGGLDVVSLPSLEEKG